MNLEIITPESCLFKGEAKTVTVPSTQGPFTMLEHHAPIVAILEAGKVVLTDLNDQVLEFTIAGGFCERHDGTVIICGENGKRNPEGLTDRKGGKTENGERKIEN